MVLFVYSTISPIASKNKHIENISHVWFNFIPHNSSLDIDTNEWLALTNEETKDIHYYLASKTWLFLIIKKRKEIWETR